MVREETVSAVLDTQMEPFLRSIGEFDRVVSGRAACMICGESVTLDSITLVAPKGARVVYVCGEPTCMLRYALGDPSMPEEPALL